MNWTELLQTEIGSTYRATQNLIDLVDEESLDWAPPSGSNWMTVGQLLMHLTEACGTAFRGFVTGNWGIPEGVEMSAEEMLPAADKMPTVSSIAQAKQLLDKDKQLALDMLARCTEDRLANEKSTAPWDPGEMVLGHRLLEMVWHLNQHKSQLFYYLKLQGKPVHTGHLWGM
jgi:uncharacterized damage-inducible protein DinB